MSSDKNANLNLAKKYLIHYFTQIAGGQGIFLPNETKTEIESIVDCIATGVSEGLKEDIISVFNKMIEGDQQIWDYLQVKAPLPAQGTNNLMRDVISGIDNSGLEPMIVAETKGELLEVKERVLAVLSRIEDKGLAIMRNNSGDGQNEGRGQVLNLLTEEVERLEKEIKR